MRLLLFIHVLRYSLLIKFVIWVIFLWVTVVYLRLRNVKHIFDISFKILFVGWLARDDYCSTFLGESWKLTKGSMVVTSGFRHFNFFVTQMSSFVVSTDYFQVLRSLGTMVRKVLF